MISDKNRLAVVKKFNALDFQNNKELNNLVVLASEICNVPIAMITIMGQDVQWIKAKQGTDFTENTPENSFCKYLIDATEPMIVTDTLSDNRFKDHALVTGDTAIRFYAGAPLIANDGYHLGSLCVFDQKPKETFTDRQIELLVILSKQVMNLLELEMNLILVEQQKAEVAKAERKLRAFFDSSSSCHLLLGNDFEILDYNRAVFNFIKRVSGQQIKIGDNVLNFVSPSYKTIFVKDFKRVLLGKRVSRETQIEYGQATPVWWDILLEPVKDDEGNVFSVSFTATDVNERKLHLAEITSKNESLLNIAYIQSHGYRRPVASILGLMEVIKHDNYESSKECLMMMEHAVKDLDKQICCVVDSVQTLSQTTLIA